MRLMEEFGDDFDRMGAEAVQRTCCVPRWISDLEIEIAYCMREEIPANTTLRPKLKKAVQASEVA